MKEMQRTTEIKKGRRKQEVLRRTNGLLSFNMTRTAEETKRPTILLFAALTSLPNRCLAAIRGYIYRHID
jgi:hypothetical protein